MTKEEAIKELRGFIGQLTEGCQEAIKILIPELKEDEDERIRKEIIECIETLIKAPGANPRLCDWLAWLEKQKEQKPEWSEEDKHRCKDAIYFLETAKKHYADTSEIELTIEWLKSLQTQAKQEHRPILEVFGFKVGDKVRLKDGDGRAHIIKKFEKLKRVHGPDLYHVLFEDNTASDHIITGSEYPNGYYTQMEKLEEEPEKIREIRACIGYALACVPNEKIKDFGVSLKDCLDYVAPVDKGLREEPKMDLEKEIMKWQGYEAFPEGTDITPLPKAMDIVERTARYFYELGLKRKEE